MYSKFSIVQFTTLSYIQPQCCNSFCMDVTSANSSATTKNPISIGQNHIELMPKKRGRPSKNGTKSNTQMVITSTESLTDRSMHEQNYHHPTTKKRQHREGTCWQRSVKSKPVSASPTSLSSSSSSYDMHPNNTCSSMNCMNNSQQQTSIPVKYEELPNIPHETVQTAKKRIVRSSISIRELLN